MRRPISQREARRLKNEVASLREKLSAAHNQYVSEYPGGYHIMTFTPNPQNLGRIEAGRLLGAAFIGKKYGDDLMIYMVPKP